MAQVALLPNGRQWFDKLTMSGLGELTVSGHVRPVLVEGRMAGLRVRDAASSLGRGSTSTPSTAHPEPAEGFLASHTLSPGATCAISVSRP